MVPVRRAVRPRPVPFAVVPALWYAHVCEGCVRLKARSGCLLHLALNPAFVVSIDSERYVMYAACDVCPQTTVQQLGPGFNVQMQKTCDACGGRGRTFKQSCEVCKGAKVVEESKTLDAVIGM